MSRESYTIRRKRKLAERTRETRFNLRFDVKAYGGDFDPPYTAFVAKEFKAVEKQIYNLLEPQQVADLYSFFHNPEKRPSLRGMQRIYAANHTLCRVVYQKVSASYPLLTSTFHVAVDKATHGIGVVPVAVMHLGRFQTPDGTRYFGTDKFMLDGRVAKGRVCFGRHALERLLERVVCASTHMVQLIWHKALWSLPLLENCGERFRLYLDFTDLYPWKLDNKHRHLRIYVFAGYVPAIIEKGDVIARTILMPGMSGTPEEGKVDPDIKYNSLEKLLGLAKFGLSPFLMLDVSKDNFKIVSRYTGAKSGQPAK